MRNKAFYGPFTLVDVDEPTVTPDGEIFLKLYDNKGNVVGCSFDFIFLDKLNAKLHKATHQIEACGHDD